MAKCPGAKEAADMSELRTNLIVAAVVAAMMCVIAVVGWLWATYM